MLRPKNVNISNKELTEIRKRVEKILFKIDVDIYETIDSILHIRHLSEYEDDYIFYKNEHEYDEELKKFKTEGGTKAEFEKIIKESTKYLKEIKIMKYRFKEKYSWKKISQEVGLSERQCQRIKDKILNREIIYWLEDENYIISTCR